MMRFTPPPEPPDFKKSVERSVRKIEQAFNNPNPPASSNPTGKKRAIKFTEKWKDYKAEFSKAQSGKCGYCEIRVIAGQDGDVEHYAPKGEVWEVDPLAPGQEVEFLSKVVGRKPKILAQQGYWWLAYDWLNYLLACAICNQNWKGAIFPVTETSRTLPPDQKTLEKPLLLNPFRGKDPGECLRFTDLGQIEARDKSHEGLATIATCGLDRTSLMKARKEKAEKAYHLANKLSDARDKNDQPAMQECYNDFLKLGNQEYDYCGMVRIIFEEQTLISWEDLEFLAAPTSPGG